MQTLKFREVQLMRMAELRKKLDAAEKVETCRRIRSGQSPESYKRVRSSRSLSRGRQHSSEKQRRYSNSLDDKEIVQKIESEHVQPVDYDPKDPYSRLSANIKRFQYLHRLDDPTLCTYKENLKKQLLRLERFRDVSFGIHSVARHPLVPHQSWFFRRSTLLSIVCSDFSSTYAASLRSSNSTRGRKSHQSPRSTANHSHDSRTSCPPSGRKRKGILSFLYLCNEVSLLSKTCLMRK
ncbi:unnamed protein product [Angiostrongylus costaricensis]|uniref:Splicing factor, arginine/serine-rich 16 n=1 Tax=Angiostrongylus costaricensis TaxID=334426 RepID=A0A0R3PUH5_ANGCS|nr:unnamed protein product [Angiostrongylus costaricensis]